MAKISAIKNTGRYHNRPTAEGASKTYLAMDKIIKNTHQPPASAQPTVGSSFEKKPSALFY